MWKFNILICFVVSSDFSAIHKSLECVFNVLFLCVAQAGCEHALPGCTCELQDPHCHLRSLHTHHGAAMEPLCQWHLHPLPASRRLRGSKPQDQGWWHQQPAATSTTSWAPSCCWCSWRSQIWRDRLPDQRWLHHQRQARGRGGIPSFQLDGEILWGVRQNSSVWWLRSLRVPTQLLKGLCPTRTLPPWWSLHVLRGIQRGGSRSSQVY